MLRVELAVLLIPEGVKLEMRLGHSMGWFKFRRFDHVDAGNSNTAVTE